MVRSRYSGRAAPNRQSASAPARRAPRPRAGWFRMRLVPAPVPAPTRLPVRAPRQVGLSVQNLRSASSGTKVCQKTLVYKRLIWVDIEVHYPI